MPGIDFFLNLIQEFIEGLPCFSFAGKGFRGLRIVLVDNEPGIDPSIAERESLDFVARVHDVRSFAQGEGRRVMRLLPELVVVAIGKRIEGEFTIERHAAELDVEALTAPVRPGNTQLRPFGALLAAGLIGAD